MSDKKRRIKINSSSLRQVYTTALMPDICCVTCWNREENSEAAPDCRELAGHWQLDRGVASIWPGFPTSTWFSSFIRAKFHRKATSNKPTLCHDGVRPSFLNKSRGKNTTHNSKMTNHPLSRLIWAAIAVPLDDDGLGLVWNFSLPFSSVLIPCPGGGVVHKGRKCSQFTL